MEAQAVLQHLRSPLPLITLHPVGCSAAGGAAAAKAAKDHMDKKVLAARPQDGAAKFPNKPRPQKLEARSPKE